MNWSVINGTPDITKDEAKVIYDNLNKDFDLFFKCRDCNSECNKDVIVDKFLINIQNSVNKVLRNR